MLTAGLASKVASIVPTSCKMKLTLVPALSMLKLVTVRSGSNGGGAAAATFQPIASKAVKSETEIASTTPGLPNASKASGVEFVAQSPRSPPSGETLKSCRSVVPLSTEKYPAVEPDRSWVVGDEK